MTQNIYDDSDFFSGYAQLGRSRHGLAGAPEWPALERLLPDLHGSAVADLGCGYGWFCRAAVEKGASSVLGLDLSEKMLAKAVSLETAVVSPTAATKGACLQGKITYRRQDLEELSLPPNSFNLVYSSLTLHYIKDLDRLFKTVRQALRPGGCLLFSAEHPIYTAPLNQAWTTDAKGLKSWPVNNYQTEGERRSDWIVPGVIKQHRTLGTVLNLLIANGFSLAHLEEWGPSAEQVAVAPELAEERERPMLVLVKATTADRTAGA